MWFTMTKYTGLYYSNLVTVLPISRLHVPVWLLCLWPHWHQVWPCDLLWQSGERCMPVLSNSFHRLLHDFLSLPPPSNSRSQIGAIPSDWSRVKRHNTEPQGISADREQHGLSKPLDVCGSCCCIAQHKLADTKWLLQSKPDCYLPYALHS